VLAFDTTQATLSNRIKLYINGTQVTSFSNASYVTQDFQLAINSAVQHTISSLLPFLARYFDGYITEVNFIDGSQLTPASFGETDAVTGRWKAKAYSGTYGTNGFYLKFADNSGTTSTTLGKDSSGNGNNWTPNNFSVTAGVGNDSLVDSPTNYGSDTGVGGEVRGNYSTYLPIATVVSGGGIGLATLANGNLDASSAAANFYDCFSTFNVPNYGKYYFEWTITAVGTNHYLGLGSRLSWASASRIYQNNGNKVINGTGSAYGATYTSADVIGCAIDMDAGTLVMYKNNTSQGTLASDLLSSLPTEGWAIIAEIRGTAAHSINFGQRPFAYTAPTGFKALCTTNFPIPTIQKPSKYMDAIAYTGTGASNSISSLGFSPDLVWIKNRGGATSHAIYDTTRLATKQLSSDTTGDEATSSTGLTAFGSNGFTLGTSTLVNTSGTQYVAWAWDEAPIAGMDIVDYTGNGANRTIVHTLGVAPKMLIVKARTTAGADQGWPVWHTSSANTTYLQLNSTGGTATGADYWNSTSPTSSVFSVGTNVAVNASSDTYIAYLFAEVDGFSKFGSYAGNGSTDGPFVYCGFRPKYILIKSSAYNWIAYDSSRDTYNVSNLKIALNTAQIENGAGVGGPTFNMLDILSNGFKLRSANVDTNSGTLIFAAFAESPFKYARAR
jgi:hypothetical protein